jgi:DNA polymerase-3 subunit beta
MTNVNIDLNLVKACAVCASKEEARYYLNGVYITSDGEALVSVATDGHRLAAFRHTIDQDAPLAPFGVIVPLAIIAGIKLNKVGTIATLAHVEGLKWSIAHNGQSITFDAVDGTFPDWRRVVPKEASGEVAQFNPSYIGDFAKIAKILGGKKDTPVIIAHNGSGPSLVSFGVDIDGIACLMPIREKGRGMIIPHWIHSTPNKDQDKAA